ncbi:hypothetical protein [Roseateles sp.]|uniref:hypothetical protein n=1 Tax=Roseateles sp. TaxID=1971397 RepID=UPI0031D78956
MSYTVYVAAEPSADGNFAVCEYFTTSDGNPDNQIDGSEIHIPKEAGECIFAPAESTSLILIGATFKTIGSVAGMNASNFAPADDFNNVSFSMPANTITKGVVLLFSTPGTVQNLYPSSDPQVINDGPSNCP